MDVEKFRVFCLSLPHATEHLPFDDVTLVFKIGGEKIFAILPLDVANCANLKCDPEKAPELRTEFVGVKPGFHMNKKYWNTVHFFADVSDELIFEWVKHSYDLVYHKMTRKLKDQYPL